MKRAQKITLLFVFSAIPAIFAASTAVYALIYDNNQGEAFDTVTGLYRHSYLLKIFCITFGAIFFAILAFLSAILLAISILDKFEIGGGR